MPEESTHDESEHEKSGKTKKSDDQLLKSPRKILSKEKIKEKILWKLSCPRRERVDP